MNRLTLTALALLLIALGAFHLADRLAVPILWCLPAVPIAWFVLAAVGRKIHVVWVARTLARETAAEREAEDSAARSIDLARRFQATLAGQAGFTGTLASLECAVFAPWPGTDEDAVLDDIERSEPESRRTVVRGLHHLQAAAVRGLSHPGHPLYLESRRILGSLGYAPPLLFAGLRAHASWRRRRTALDPTAPEEALAMRLVRARMHRAALAVLANAVPTARALRLERLSRFLIVVERGEETGAPLRVEEFAEHAAEMILLVGRRIRELVPASPLISAVPGGAGTLERAVSQVRRITSGLVLLHSDYPELSEPICLVLSRLLNVPNPLIREQIERGVLTARPDTLLQSHLRGLALLSEGRPREAVAEFEHVCAAEGALMTQATFSLAIALRRIGDTDGAERALRHCASTRATDPDARLFLARFLADSGDERRARQTYDAAVAEFPENAVLRVAYAQDLLEWGDELTARRHLETAHRQRPADARLAFLAGRARVVSGQPDEAIEPLKRAVIGLSGGERVEACFWLLCAYRDQGEHDRALELADGLLGQLSTGQEGLLDDLAEYFEERHEYVRARRAVERARQLRGGDWG